jgi:hypothetical protein
MRTITKYQANDGSEWVKQDDCIKREQMIRDVDGAMSCLRDHPTERGWEGYILHDKEALVQCKAMLFKISNTEGILKWWIDGQKADHGKVDSDFLETHPSWFCRMLDGGHSPLSSAYNRLQCIDDELREWNRPFYAGHGKGQGKMVEINPLS